jgi:hypothetical protein
VSIHKVRDIKYILLFLGITLIAVAFILMIQDSVVYDNDNDAYALPLFTGKVIPEVMGFHDISTLTFKRGYDMLTLSIKVKGDITSISNYRYETVYIWEMEHIDILLSKKHYIIVLPYFPEGHVIGYNGWYIAVYDASSNRWIVPMISIDNPVSSSSSGSSNTISIGIPTSIVGNPLLILSYKVSVMVNVDTQVNPMPDYIMDTAPDNSNLTPVFLPSLDHDR